MHFLHHHKLELLLLVIGCLLRLSMTWNYAVTWSYDSELHWKVVEWILRHHQIPKPDDLLEAQHPPLFYLVVAGLMALGAEREDMVWVSIICGMIRLVLLWVGLELYLPRSRAARLVALALAAILATSVQVDGMVYMEAMSCMLLTGALVLIPIVFRHEGWSRVRNSAGLGLLFGLALLTKISAVIVITAFSVTAGLELLLGRANGRTRIYRVLSWVVMMVVCVAVSGWYFARNVRDYGRPFVQAFELKTQHNVVVDAEKTPYLDRRSLGFLFGWDKAVMLFPYRPGLGQGARSRFFPVAVASTFVDYWDFSFSGVDPMGTVNGWPGGQLRPITPRIFRSSLYAMWGGTTIFLATVLTWFVVTVRVIRRRKWGMIAVVLVPFFVLVATAHFAIRYPIDDYGVIKGIYMQVGATPLCALFGLAVAWTLRERRRWPLFAILMAALWLVACYTFYCRLRFPLLPLG